MIATRLVFKIWRQFCWTAQHYEGFSLWKNQLSVNKDK